MRFTSPALASLMLAGSLAFSAQVAAQDIAPEPETAPAVQQNQYTDQELDMFASSYQAIMEVREKYAAELEAVEDEDKSQALIAKANEEINNLVGRYGLSVEKYNEIAQSLQNDPELVQRVMDKLQ